MSADRHLAADRHQSKVMMAGHEHEERRQLEDRAIGLGRERSSLRMSLIPSARVWSRPNGPQRCGPMRLCMSEIALRSNQIMRCRGHHERANPTRHLISTDHRPASRSRSCRAGRRSRARTVGRTVGPTLEASVAVEERAITRLQPHVGDQLAGSTAWRALPGVLSPPGTLKSMATTPRGTPSSEAAGRISSPGPSAPSPGRRSRHPSDRGRSDWPGRPARAPAG